MLLPMKQWVIPIVIGLAILGIAIINVVTIRDAYAGDKVMTFGAKVTLAIFDVLAVVILALVWRFAAKK